MVWQLDFVIKIGGKQGNWSRIFASRRRLAARFFTRLISSSTPLLFSLAFLLPFLPLPNRADPSPEAKAAAEKAYRTAKTAAQSSASDLQKQIDLAHSIFDLAEFSPNDSERATLAQEGIDAAKRAIQLDPKSAAAHYYLAMNLGQLARTKSLGALKLVREMEQEFLQAIHLDPKIDYAGPERSLGQLYRDAPGWPTSIGSKTKARSHLLRAIELEPDFPDNQLGYIEALANWHDRLALQTALHKYRTDILPKAKQKFTGEKWKFSWEDWDRSLAELTSKSQKMDAEHKHGE
jgi:tetratricopeptide (TPR) repeat protein